MFVMEHYKLSLLTLHASYKESVHHVTFTALYMNVQMYVNHHCLEYLYTVKSKCKYIVKSTVALQYLL